MDADWSVSPVTKQNKDSAWSQLGTSGSGNHFVEFGLFTAHSKINEDLKPGTYVALLSHSGSRGTGAAVCDHYSKLAFSQFRATCRANCSGSRGCRSIRRRARNTGTRWS